MKASFGYFLLMFHFIAIQAKGQTIKVSYERKPNIEYQLRNVTDPLIRQKVSNYLISNQKTYELSFSQNKSLFDEVGIMGVYNPDIIDESTTGAIFKNLSANEMVFTKSLDGKQYLIKDSIPHFNWKILEDFKSVNGVKCQKAITQENDNTIIAWFTQNPKYNRLGPEHYGMEDALIMELKTPFFTFLAAEIETNDQVLDFHKPEHGELVNLEKYRKVEKAFFAKMGIMGFKK